MYTLYKFHFLNGISEINQLFDDILIIWPAPVYIYSISQSEYTPHIFVNIYYIFSCDNTEDIPLCYNVK